MIIEIFGKKDCVWCKRAQDECWKHQLDYEYHDVYNDLGTDEFKDLFERRAVGARTFPIVIVDDHYIGGFTELKKLLMENHEH